MEKFDSKEYRDNLAKELKELRADTEDKEDDERGRELAKNVIDEVSKTFGYGMAKEIHSVDRDNSINKDEKEKMKRDMEEAVAENDDIDDIKEEVRIIKEVENALVTQKKDIERISKVLGEQNLKKCAALWVFRSNDLAAGWLDLPKSDKELYEILSKYL